MVRIRMARFGRPHRPFYRISAVDSRVKRDGAVIEQLGWYDPMSKDPTKTLVLHADRIKHWLSVGAQPSDTVRDMLAKNKMIDEAAWKEAIAERIEARKKGAEKKAAAAAAGAAKKDEKKA